MRLTRGPKRHPRGKSVSRCPQCGSVHLVYEAGLVTGQKYHCLDCNYIGSLIVESDLREIDPDEE
jgi:transposase-like protein